MKWLWAILLTVGIFFLATALQGREVVKDAAYYAARARRAKRKKYEARKAVHMKDMFVPDEKDPA